MLVPHRDPAIISLFFNAVPDRDPALLVSKVEK